MKFSTMFHICSTIKKIIVQKSIKHKKYSDILTKWDTQVIKWDAERSEKLVLIIIIIIIIFFTLRKETIALPGKIKIL